MENTIKNKSIPRLHRKKAVLGFALWVLLFALIILTNAKATALEGSLFSYSLRYPGGINGQKALAARQYAINSDEYEGFWPTFWRQDYLEIASQNQNANAQVISFSGSGAFVWGGAEFINGGWGGEAENAACYISSVLAWRLFGSTDIIGMPVKIDGREFAVRGIFEDEQALALANFGEEGHPLGWQAAEIPCGGYDITYDGAKLFAMQSGLGTPSGAQNSIAIARLVRAMAAAAPALLLVFFLVRAFSFFLRGKSMLARKCVILGAVLLFAACLPKILSSMPPHLVPNRWSDFSFLPNLLQNYKAQYLEFLQMPFAIKDEALRLGLPAFFLLVFASLILCAVCIMRAAGIASKNVVTAQETANKAEALPAHESNGQQGQKELPPYLPYNESAECSDCPQ